ncbi:MAG: inositol monophosphatase family protein [Cytophagaceae bacterium]
MKLNTEQLSELKDAAIIAGKAAALIISESASKEIKAEHKPSGTSPAGQVVTEVDHKAQEAILNILSPTIHKFDLGLLTEETDDDKSRLQKDYFWCIDPLDGTLPFVEKRPGYSVSVALIAKSGIPVVGVVVDPVSGDVYHAVNGNGAYLNNEKIIADNAGKKEELFKIVLEKNYLSIEQYDKYVSELLQALKKEGYNNCIIAEGGGGVMNACSLIKSQGCYFKLPKKTKGGGCFWDYAAISCLFNELGFFACDFNGEALQLNKPDTIYMNETGVLFCANETVKKRMMEVARSI